MPIENLRIPGGARWIGLRISASLLALIGSSATAAPLPTIEKRKSVGTGRAESIRRQARDCSAPRSRRTASGIRGSGSCGTRWVLGSDQPPCGRNPKHGVCRHVISFSQSSVGHAAEDNGEAERTGFGFDLAALQSK